MAMKNKKATAVANWLYADATGDTSVIQPGDLREVAEAVTEVIVRDEEAEKKKNEE